MSRTPLPFAVDDLAAFARSLAGQLADHDGRPGHVELLNMLARAGGFRNWQHLHAQHATLADLATPPTPAVPVDTDRLARIARYFDDEGYLLRWPGKAGHRPDCLWVLWAALPPRTDMHEREVNERLNERHRFGDHALLRRELVDRELLWRTVDGRRYRRIEKAPPPEARALIRLITARRAGR